MYKFAFITILLFLVSCHGHVDFDVASSSSSSNESNDSGTSYTPGLTQNLSGFHMGASWLTGSSGPFSDLTGEDRGFSIHSDPRGGAYLLGFSTSDLVEANANKDLILIRYNADASLDWVKHYGSVTLPNNTAGEAVFSANQTDRAPEMVFDDSDNPIIVVSTQSALYDTLDSLDVALINVNRTNGSIIWGKQYGQSISSANSQDYVISARKSGSKIYIACVTNGAFAGNTHGGNDDVLIIEADLNGNYLTSHQFNTRAVGGAATSNERVYAMEVVSDGLIFSGISANNVWSATGGTTFAAFLVKTNFSYTTQWSYTFGDNAPTGLGINNSGKLYLLNSLEVDSSGNIYAGGYASAGTGGTGLKEDCSAECSVVLSLTSSGASRWLTHFGVTTSASSPFVANTANDQITNIHVTDEGLYFVGYTQDDLFDTKNSTTNTSVTVGKLNKDTGAIIWGDQLGDSKYGSEFLAGSHTSHERPTDLYVFGDRLLVSGWTMNSTSETNQGSRDNFVFSWNKSTGAMDSP
ncbi:hypothetical protein [Bacteriovorax sp. DB6_IX]|uniref:hypothetical protein n=1 Tax=Bacteriovorax sp. DB6_IX TaxID=1353530 RepID=UPI00038A0511|nr:hypothetical protein [Bacteriovorax sp. DB6_IX]EQC51481.1 hypothetical protein M901_2815 [Bacteriovorax sp. DB6_IX]